MTNIAFSWRPMAAADLETVSRIAGKVHALLPERPDVLAEKFRLFPRGCFIFESDKAMLGYAIAHPWMLGDIPPLDGFLNELPKTPECLYLHDAALLPEGRGHSASPRLIEDLRRVAASIDLHWLALVSVYRTYLLWGRFGFSTVQDPALSDKLSTYGPSAQYMTAPV
ncbi:GNAT family N-acetyltransferase [Rhodoblastus sp.]|uniref:GNAT family N-acetyltransferase n=1 Tax=Rhodoblastus sp. TaxID=1962975 RepID=UPI0025E55D67|nr:GNAT family N-acetyltransferase [Rhodoblastus sp.]